MFFAVCGNENRDLNDQREVAVTEENGDSSTFVRVLFFCTVYGKICQVHTYRSRLRIGNYYVVRQEIHGEPSKRKPTFQAGQSFGLFLNPFLSFFKNSSPVFRFKDYNLPSHQYAYQTYYGDGSEVEPAVLQHIRAVTWSCAVGFRWQNGDVLVVDNLTVQHARMSFIGQRRILAVLSVN